MKETVQHSTLHHLKKNSAKPAPRFALYHTKRSTQSTSCCRRLLRACAYVLHRDWTVPRLPATAQRRLLQGAALRISQRQSRLRPWRLHPAVNMSCSCSAWGRATLKVRKGLRRMASKEKNTNSTATTDTTETPATIETIETTETTGCAQCTESTRVQRVHNVQRVQRGYESTESL